MQKIVLGDYPFCFFEKGGGCGVDLYYGLDLADGYELF